MAQIITPERTWLADKYNPSAPSIWAAGVDGVPVPDLVNVKDWGVRGDGYRDDTADIQRALNAMPASGAALWFARGIYIVSSYLTANKDRVKYCGEGAASVFKLAPHIDSMNMFNVTGEDVTIVDLTFDGNADNQDPANSYRGVSPCGGANNMIIDRCRFRSFHGDGMIRASSSGEVIYRLKIINCVFTDVRAVIIEGVNQGGGAIVLNNNVRRCDIVHNFIDCALDSHIYAIQVEPDTPPDYTDNNIKINDNFIRGSGAAIGVLTNYTSVVDISHNIISGITAGVGIQVLGASSVNIEDNKITDPVSDSVGIRVTSNDGNGDPAYTNMSSYVVKDNQVVGYGTATEGGISILGHSGFEIGQVDISHNHVLSAPADASGITAVYADDLRLSDNDVYDNAENGIWAVYCDSVVLGGNIIKANGGWGILLDTCTDVMRSATLATDNIVSGNTAGPVSII